MRPRPCKRLQPLYVFPAAGSQPLFGWWGVCRWSGLVSPEFGLTALSCGAAPPTLSQLTCLVLLVTGSWIGYRRPAGVEKEIQKLARQGALTYLFLVFLFVCLVFLT